MRDGTKKAACNIVRGDEVRLSPHSNEWGVVDFVVRSDVTKDVPLVFLSAGLLITSYHPVYHLGEWKFPIHITVPHLSKCKSLYSFLLCGNKQSISIGGMQVIALCHGITDDPVASHPFLGTEVARGAIESMCHASDGVVLVKAVTRDPFTQLVCGFQ
jgi:hypothetical protein